MAPSGSPAKLFGTVIAASPSCGAGTPARRHPSRRSRRPSRGACRRRSPRWRRRRGARPPASAPHSSYAASVPARQTTGWPSFSSRSAATPSVGPATSTKTPPAAKRFVANVARAVCSATVPIVARNTGSRGLVAERLERRAVAAHLPGLAGRRPAGQLLAEVGELGQPGDRPLAGGDLGVALPDGSRRSPHRGRPPPRAGRTAPRRRPRGRRSASPRRTTRRPGRRPGRRAPPRSAARWCCGRSGGRRRRACRAGCRRAAP